MDLPTSAETWSKIGGQIVDVNVAYDGSGFKWKGRDQEWKGMVTSIPCSTLVDNDGELFVAKLFMKFIGDHGAFNVVPRVQVKFLESGNTVYENFPEQTISPEDGSDNEWLEIAQSRILSTASNHGITAEQAADENFMFCRFTTVVRNTTIQYFADHAYLTTVENLALYVPPKDDLLYNGDFEVGTDQELFNIEGWNSQSDAVLQTIYDNDAPSGGAFLRVGLARTTGNLNFPILD